ncbi:protein BLISTER isoform X2 [Cynara cardunculus var. scolymus]|uniref:protein BLISTER isoform X2 n=1 Tax=Cynara cardunculus var. scolymus TaxID=59895 RepID=UPI000D626C73|nr:protein BLISTER isoform X2 [Cynara cardunculus var. scolymus]
MYLRGKHLELEEFRKKKAAAKKAASSNAAPSANGDLHETKSSVSDTVAVADGTNDVGVGKNENKTIDVHETEPHSMYAIHANPISSSNKHSTSPGQTYSVDKKLEHDALYGSGSDLLAPQELKNAKLNAEYAVDIEKSRTFDHPEEDVHSSFNHFSNTRLEDALKNSRNDHLKDFTSTIPVTSQVPVTKSSPERSLGTSFANSSSQTDLLANGPTYRDYSSEVGKSPEVVLGHRYPSVSAVGDRNHNNLVDHPASENSSSFTVSTSFRTEAVPSHNQTSMSPSVAGRRSRPSFLDSIVSRNSSTSLSEADKANPFSSKVYPVEAPVSSDPKNFMNSSIANMGDLFRQGVNELDMERRNNFHSTKQNEDFAALEQHIEDLTQEKFSLQRALEASQVLAESLATENSALTDSYNQQGGVVNQLKSDMERLQEEIKGLLVELEAVRSEYGNARLECNAADERAKLLASEVIGLEEKALRLRSNELKLERQLENLEAEMSSQKRRISSLEKERQDLQFTIDALQEEKKLLQSKLRKAPGIGNSVDTKKSQPAKKEASTSTDDLVNESEDPTPAIQSTLGENDASLQLQSGNFGLEVSSLSIPPDQMRMIQNINTLISELAMEKEELTQALSTESSLCSKLKNLNKELSHKLEVQTQRLELLTSQSMVADNIPVRKSPPRTVVDNTPYADEGDEVVERVLGWIMKLFPGGPSKRQTKHL